MSVTSIVLSSGGVDSTTCIGMAIERFGKENVTTVSVTYGQKHIRELSAAAKIAEYYGLDHEVLDLSQIYTKSNSSLLAHSTEDIPEESYAEQLEKAENGVSTVIPLRNGLMLTAVAALAQSIYPDDEVHIYMGAHADDAAGDAYADCRPDFVEYMTKAIDIGTYNLVKVEAPLVNWNKARVVKEGLRLKVPYYLTTSCYNGRDRACARCGTCLDRIAAFRANNAIDPIEYEGEDPFADMR